MAATLSNATTDSILKDKNEDNTLGYEQNCCLQMESTIQTLVNDVKPLTEIIKILSEDWWHYHTNEEVKLDGGHYVDKVTTRDSSTCICEDIKPQLCEAQE